MERKRVGSRTLTDSERFNCRRLGIRRCYRYKTTLLNIRKICTMKKTDVVFVPPLQYFFVDVFVDRLKGHRYSSLVLLVGSNHLQGHLLCFHIYVTILCKS